MSGAPTSVGVQEYRDIAIELVDVLPGRRALDPNWVETLAADFKERGQRTPIEVIQRGDRFQLVSGGHRVSAGRLNRQATISAIVKQPADFAHDAQIKLAEIVENFMRRELSALDRAFDVAAWREIFELVRGEVKRGGNRRGKVQSLKSETLNGSADLDTISHLFADNFTVAAQKALCLSRAAVFRSLTIAGIGETARQAIALLPIADNQTELLALAAEPEARRATIVEHLVAGAASVADAIAIIDDLAPSLPREPYERISETFSRLKAEQQYRFFDLHEDAIAAWMASR